jgi:transcriptional regulator with XRE-family HTH domain
MKNVTKNVIAYKNIRSMLAANIKKYRAKNKLSQEELAFRAGLHRTYISSIECMERNVTIDSVEKIAEAFNIPIYRLFE